MQPPSCNSRSLNVFVMCKAPPKHVPELPAPFIGHASPSNTPGMSSNALPTAKKAARAKNAPPPTQSTHAISTHPLRGKPMATIRENSTTVVGVPKVKPPGCRSEGLTKASSLDQPREDAYAKQAPPPPRAELQPQT